MELVIAIGTLDYSRTAAIQQYPGGAVLIKYVLLVSFALGSAAAEAAHSRIDCAIILGSSPDMPAEDSAINKCVSDSLESDRQLKVDKQRKANEELAEKLASKSQQIFVNEFKIYDVDSAGGVNVGGFFSNPNKTQAIKYLRLRATLYNAVGDAIRSEISGDSSIWLKITGPMNFSDEPKSAYWRGAWYNFTATCAKIESLQVQYMNGTVTTLAGRQLLEAISPSIRDDCKPK